MTVSPLDPTADAAPLAPAPTPVLPAQTLQPALPAYMTAKPEQTAAVQPTTTPAPAPQTTSQGGAPDPMGNLARMAGVDMATGKQIIQKYLKDGGVGLNPNELAWCAAAMNASLAQVGLPGSGSQRARSFLNYGNPVEVPQHGDIVVFQRGGPNSGLGHVGYVDQVNPDGTIRVLGGNQSGGIGYSTYDTKDVLGYRRIPGAVAITDPEKVKDWKSTGYGAEAQAQMRAQDQAKPEAPPKTPTEMAGDALQSGLTGALKAEEKQQKPFQMSPLQPTVSLPSQPFATGAKDAYAQLLEKTPSLQGDRNPQPVARTPAVSTPPKAFMQPQQEQQNEQPQA